MNTFKKKSEKPEKNEKNSNKAEPLVDRIGKADAVKYLLNNGAFIIGRLTDEEYTKIVDKGKLTGEWKIVEGGFLSSPEVILGKVEVEGLGNYEIYVEIIGSDDEYLRTTSSILKNAGITEEIVTKVRIIEMALQMYEYELVSELIENDFSRADIDEKTLTARKKLNDELKAAVEGGKIDEVNDLLSKGADVNARFPLNGVTSLMIASCNHNVELVKLLLSKGADVNAKVPREKVTTLMLVASDGNLELVKLLVENGADITATQSDGTWTALHCAKLYGYNEVFDFLIEEAKKILEN